MPSVAGQEHVVVLGDYEVGASPIPSVAFALKQEELEEGEDGSVVLHVVLSDGHVTLHSSNQANSTGTLTMRKGEAVDPAELSVPALERSSRLHQDSWPVHSHRLVPATPLAPSLQPGWVVAYATDAAITLVATAVHQFLPPLGEQSREVRLQLEAGADLSIDQGREVATAVVASLRPLTPPDVDQLTAALKKSILPAPLLYFAHTELGVSSPLPDAVKAFAGAVVGLVRAVHPLSVMTDSDIERISQRVLVARDNMLSSPQFEASLGEGWREWQATVSHYAFLHFASGRVVSLKEMVRGATAANALPLAKECLREVLDFLIHFRSADNDYTHSSLPLADQVGEATAHAFRVNSDATVELLRQRYVELVLSEDDAYLKFLCLCIEGRPSREVLEEALEQMRRLCSYHSAVGRVAKSDALPALVAAFQDDDERVVTAACKSIRLLLSHTHVPQETTNLLVTTACKWLAKGTQAAPETLAECAALAASVTISKFECAAAQKAGASKALQAMLAQVDDHMIAHHVAVVVGVVAFSSALSRNSMGARTSLGGDGVLLSLFGLLTSASCPPELQHQVAGCVESMVVDCRPNTTVLEKNAVWLDGVVAALRNTRSNLVAHSLTKLCTYVAAYQGCYNAMRAGGLGDALQGYCEAKDRVLAIRCLNLLDTLGLKYVPNVGAWLKLLTPPELAIVVNGVTCMQAKHRYNADHTNVIVPLRKQRALQRQVDVWAVAWLAESRSLAAQRKQDEIAKAKDEAEAKRRAEEAHARQVAEQAAAKSLAELKAARARVLGDRLAGTWLFQVVATKPFLTQRVGKLVDAWTRETVTFLQIGNKATELSDSVFADVMEKLAEATPRDLATAQLRVRQSRAQIQRLKSQLGDQSKVRASMGSSGMIDAAEEGEEEMDKDKIIAMLRSRVSELELQLHKPGDS